MKMKSYMYCGTVGHKRYLPKRHSFVYKVFFLYLDIDEPNPLGNKLRFFGHNKWAAMSFYNKDHGPRTGERLRPWVEAKLLESNIKPDGGPIKLLCHGRVLGFGFTPLSVYFCFRKDSSLSAVLYEVCNTYFERHTYVLPVKNNYSATIYQKCKKELYVSPFNDMNGYYEFQITHPEETIKIDVNYKIDENLLLSTCFVGQKLPLTTLSLVRCLIIFPFLTFKIFSAIHWEAVRLWFKRLRVYKHHPS